MGAHDAPVGVSCARQINVDAIVEHNIYVIGWYGVKSHKTQFSLMRTSNSIFHRASLCCPRVVYLKVYTLTLFTDANIRAR